MSSVYSLVHIVSCPCFLSEHSGVKEIQFEKELLADLSESPWGTECWRGGVVAL